MPGELLTAWTIRLALACYVAYLAGWLIAGRENRPAAIWPTIARTIWTLGCLLFVVHVGCAFHFYHSWSHAAAFGKTADETEQLLGLRFGEGIYFSYLFLALWIIDVVALYWPGRTNPAASGRLTSPVRVALHVYLFFIAASGAIVFESGPIRWAGLAACLLLAAAAICGTYNGRWTSPSRDPRVTDLGL